VTAVTEPPVIAQPENVSDQIAALLIEDQDPAANDVEVTRNQGLSISAVEETNDIAMAAQEQPAPSGQVGADFFSAAQANLAQANSCSNDLRNLADQAKVYFPSGALTGEATGIAQARLIGTIAQRCPGVTIQVEGHSDASGNPAINLRLSQERAEAVVARVAAAGIDTSKMVAVGMGDAYPSGVVGPEASAYYDRRVEFTIVDTVQNASFTQPTFGAGIQTAQATACVSALQTAANNTVITYSPGSVIVSPADMSAALELARMAQACPEARLRVVGQHAEEFGTIEDAATGRLRAIALMTTMVGAGYDATQIIMAAPSGSTPVQGLGNARVDFDVILEEL
jgi:outer membrane protein OmpA-like peptidoglycan-associated protein